ncbi:MAG: GPO family capsid scaffolding protein [Zymomonas mobilis]|uniref:GPO family capsid scaffolding protein n=1 Tax=Zymomonas mobilis TaxID=542 RepID=UPI0039E72E39
MPKISKPIRVAVSGNTSDQRTIDRDMIQNMADTYDPNIYAARLNCEHIAGVTPLPNGQFPAYGTVKSLSAEEYTFSVDGVEQTQLALYAVVEVNDEFLELSAKDQKVYWSIEATPKFADTDKWYLTGLAITDSPASLCTEVAKFSKTQEQKFSSLCECFELQKDTHESILQKLNSIGKAILGISNIDAVKAKEPAAPEPQKEAKEQVSQADYSAAFKEISNAVSELVSVVATLKEADDKKFAEIEKQVVAFTAFQEKVETSPSNNFKREPVSGGNPASIMSQF